MTRAKKQPTLHRSTTIRAAWDKGPEFGRHGCDLILSVRGPKGAMLIVLATGMYLPNEYYEYDAIKARYPDYKPPSYPYDFSLEHHQPTRSKKLMRTESCEYIRNKSCRVHQYSTTDDEFSHALIHHGSEHVFHMLEEEYWKKCQPEWLPEPAFNAFSEPYEHTKDGLKFSEDIPRTDITMDITFTSPSGSNQ